MGSLLFSPAGQIGSNTFLKTSFALSIISAILFWLLVVQPTLGVAGLVLFLLSFYPWFCVWAKRLRSGGKSPGLTFAYVILFIVLVFAIFTAALLFFSGVDFMEATMASAREEITPEEFNQQISELSGSMDPKIVLRNILLSFTLASLITVFIGDRATGTVESNDAKDVV